MEEGTWFGVEPSFANCVVVTQFEQVGVGGGAGGTGVCGNCMHASVSLP
jgi:hypothetical protein